MRIIYPAEHLEDETVARVVCRTRQNRWSDRGTGISPLPGGLVCAGIVGLRGMVRILPGAFCGLGQGIGRIREDPFGKLRVDIQGRMSSAGIVELRESDECRAIERDCNSGV